MDFYHFFFQPTSGPWYAGNVWGNMVAWVICGAVAIVWARRKLIKWNHHREQREDERHAALKAHITHEHDLRHRQLMKAVGKHKQ